MGKSYDLSTLSVLVVDDSSYMVSIIKALLRGFGVHQIHDANDGIDAFEVLRNSQIDIVIADFAMDPIDGLEFTRLVRTAPDSPRPQVPVIMVTADGRRETVESSRDSGVTEYLCKPISAHGLYKRIVEVIERPRPFVRQPDFVGPDRRRHDDSNYEGEERRKVVEEQALDELDDESSEQAKTA